MASNPRKSHDTQYSPQDIIELICEEGSSDVDKEDSYDGGWPGIINQTTISEIHEITFISVSSN